MAKDTVPTLPPIYEAVKTALIERGWKIDESAVENRSGELHEFIEPNTSRRLAWIDAILRQHSRET